MSSRRREFPARATEHWSSVNNFARISSSPVNKPRKSHRLDLNRLHKHIFRLNASLRLGSAIKSTEGSENFRGLHSLAVNPQAGSAREVKRFDIYFHSLSLDASISTIFLVATDVEGNDSTSAIYLIIKSRLAQPWIYAEVPPNIRPEVNSFSSSAVLTSAEHPQVCSFALRPSP